jgi:hypothetical protein
VVVLTRLEMLSSLCELLSVNKYSELQISFLMINEEKFQNLCDFN